MSDPSNKVSRIINDWYLGKTSTSHETSGRGVAAISTGEGDNGGVSYGAYQMSTKAGTLRKYLEQTSYSDHFSGLEPATAAFNAKWRELAASEPGFAAEQHDFIRRTHYEVQVRELEAAGIDLSNRGRAVQDALWSTSVQFGWGTIDIVSDGLAEKFGANYALSDLSDTDIVEAIQDYKITHNNNLFRSSPNLWNGLLRRAREEKNDLVQLATYENMLAREGLLTDWRQSMTPSYAKAAQHSSGRPVTADIQATLNTLGYTDSHGRVLEVDGHYGKRTREAVEAFQRDHGLSVDGKAGPNTWTAMREAIRATSIELAVAPNAASVPAAAPLAAAPQMGVSATQDAASIAAMHQHIPAFDVGYQAPMPSSPPEPATPPFYPDTPSNHDTLAALQAQLRQMQREMEAIRQQHEHVREKDKEQADWRAVSNEPALRVSPAWHETRGASVSIPREIARTAYSDPRHHVHPLYADVKERLETQGHHLEEDRLTQVVGKMHRLGFQPNWEGHAVVRDDTVYVADFSPWGLKAQVNLKEPAPSVQETLQHVDAHQQMQQQERAMREQQTQSRGHGHVPMQ